MLNIHEAPSKAIRSKLSASVGTIQRKLAWSLHKDNTQILKQSIFLDVLTDLIVMINFALQTYLYKITSLYTVTYTMLYVHYTLIKPVNKTKKEST